MKKKYCCNTMYEKVEKWKCGIHKNKYECPDSIIDYNKKFDEYGIIVHGDSFSYIVINYCPWCGHELKSKRDIWFNELEKLGYKDLLFNKNIPKEYKTDKWYNSNN